MQRSDFVLAASAALAAACAPAGAVASPGGIPPWLAVRPGRMALVAEAPWPMGDEPEAALTGSFRSSRIAPDDQAARPKDAVGAAIGIAVAIERLVSPEVARVRPVGEYPPAYVRLDRLVPEVPAGTRLVVAGGFGNEAAFYAKLEAPVEKAGSLATGTPLTALGMGTAPYDPDGSDFVRIRVLVRGGAFRGRHGWLPAAYAGLPRPGGPFASTAERACRCRILEFRP
jgi:hypothetical protein